MKKLLPVGLVVEGRSTNSIVLSLPNLAGELGPIKSTTLRVARRLSNFLHAGYGVNSYEDLVRCRLLLIRVPDQSISRIVGELCESDLDLSTLAVVLCESWQFGEALEPLRARGAAVGTLLPIISPRRRWFIMDGQTKAARLARQFIEANEGKLLEIRSGRKELYFAAELLATALPIPMFIAAQQALREAGIDGNNLQSLLEELAQKMFKDFLNVSRTAWGGPLTASSPEVVEAHFVRLRQNDPGLAKFVDEQLSIARQNLTLKVKTV